MYIPDNYDLWVAYDLEMERREQACESEERWEDDEEDYS